MIGIIWIDLLKFNHIHKGEELTFIAEKLGTTDRTIYRWLKVFNLQYLVRENTKAKKLFIKM